MRQPDINRIMRAKEGLEKVIKTLSEIKWENINLHESTFLNKAKMYLDSADWSLDDVLNVGKRS